MLDSSLEDFMFKVVVVEGDWRRRSQRVPLLGCRRTNEIASPSFDHISPSFVQERRTPYPDEA